MKHPPAYVITFVGRSGSGKTTLANELVEIVKFKHRKIGAVRKSFADPLKDMLRVVGVEKGRHAFFRKWAQRIGTDVIRTDQPDFWVQQLVESVSTLDNPTIVCVDDARFPNETSCADLVVKLITTRDTGLTAEQLCHESETAWAGIKSDMTFSMDCPFDVTPFANEVLRRALGEMKQEKEVAA